MSATVVTTVLAVLLIVGASAGAAVARPTAGQVFVAGLPIVVATGAFLSGGLVWWTIALIAFTPVVGMLVAGKLGPQLDALATGGGGPSAAVLVLRSLVAVILAAIVVRWAAPMVQWLTNLDAWSVALVGLVTAAAIAALGGGRVGLARTAFVLAIVVGVLSFAVGVALGTPAHTMAPVVSVPVAGLGTIVATVVCSLLISLAHPGISQQAGGSRSFVGGVIGVGLIGFATLIGAAWLQGGSMSFPSMPLQTLNGFIAFAPQQVGALVAGIAFTIMVVVVAAALRSIRGSWQASQALPKGRWSHPVVHIGVASVVVFIVVITPLSGGWWFGCAASIAALALIFTIKTRRTGLQQSPAQPQLENSAL